MKEEKKAISPLSHQQVNELRIIVFRRVYSWLSSVAWLGELGPLEDKHSHFLDRYSAESLRGYVWDCLKDKFEISGQWEDLPRKRYMEAKDFLETLSVEILQQFMESEAGLTESTEARPSSKDIRRRFIQGVNKNRRSHGYPPLKPHHKEGNHPPTI